MKTALLFVDSRDAPIALLECADRFGERLRGLLGRSALPDDRALWIAPCGSVHTLGMRFPIDVVFVDAKGRIVRCVEALVPNRAAFALKAASVVEFAAGGVARLRLAAGDRLSIADAAGAPRRSLATSADAAPVLA